MPEDRLLVKFSVEGPEAPADPDVPRSYPQRPKIVDLEIDVGRATANGLISLVMAKLAESGGVVVERPTGS